MPISIIIGALLGLLIGSLAPTISYTFSKYLAIAIVAALDSVFGGWASNIRKQFNIKVFLSGFFINALLAMCLTYLGERLNVDIYLAAIIVFIGRIFNNLGTIRRHYVDEISENSKKEKSKKEEK